ncbi:Minichromosome maintenance protein 5 [Dictyocoela muelleri]|nr:Minichromosome maintenance protein 5 [Dictyocoela muelleri]
MDASEIRSIDLITNETLFNSEKIKSSFENFIKSFRIGENYIYRPIMNQKIRLNLEHLSSFDQNLYDEFLKRPEKVLEIFQDYCDLEIFSTGEFLSLREMNCFNKIVRTRGIIVSCSDVYSKPKVICVSCRNCMETRMVQDTIPRSCKSECGIDPFITIPERCILVDSQYAKIQECFEDIPVGEMPRHFSVLLENKMVNRVVPGTKVEITGILLVKNGKKGSQPFIKAIGIETDVKRNTSAFTEEEEEMFKKMSKGIYKKIANSIAPSIHGHEDIKKTIGCMLFGGTRRRKGNIYNRGDINVLLLGDPGMAKSQILKFVEKVAPVAVYTSGKGSSAAGLTASVIKDHNNQFYLEGGALVLADGGVCCIDEFDKMNDVDRVAIHEAMEQQTISIAKAGITTVLNTRTAILAAANPVFGRYDDYRSPSENIEFGTTILSRFDCIFIMKDEVNFEDDKRIATHVLNIHKQNEDIKKGEIEIPILRRYIQFAKRINPCLGEEAKEKLSNFYVNTRELIRRHESTLNEKSPIPITVRQLEAIIRLSESLARMELNHEVLPAHVDEAIRLFKKSTMEAVNLGYYLEGMVRSDIIQKISEVSDQIFKILPIGTACKFSRLLELKYDPNLIDKTIGMLVKQEKLILKDNGRVVVRVI